MADLVADELIFDRLQNPDRRGIDGVHSIIVGLHTKTGCFPVLVSHTLVSLPHVQWPAEFTVTTCPEVRNDVNKGATAQRIPYYPLQGAPSLAP